MRVAVHSVRERKQRSGSLSIRFKNDVILNSKARELSQKLETISEKKISLSSNRAIDNCSINIPSTKTREFSLPKIIKTPKMARLNMVESLIKKY